MSSDISLWRAQKLQGRESSLMLFQEDSIVRRYNATPQMYPLHRVSEADNDYMELNTA